MNTADPIDALRARVAALGPAQQADFRRQLEAKGIAWERVAPQDVVCGRTGRLALSPGQMHFWIQQSLYPENSAYHVAYRWRFHGVLNREALEKSLQKIVNRHEPLRTAFPVSNGEPWQSILPQCAFTLAYTNVNGSTVRLEDIARKVATEPFDLSQAPLFRAHLLRVDAHDHLLAITMHHIVSDGWSRGVLMRELTACYRAYCNGGEPELPALSRSFSDIVLAQGDWLQGAECARQRAYWQKRLDDLKQLDLPTDRSRHSTVDMASATVSRVIPVEVSSKISALANRLGTTAFIVLAAAFKLLLHRYCGQHDLPICVPVAGRADAEAAQLIGLFTNTLVLRSKLEPSMTFPEWVACVQEQFSDALEHQDFPFPMLAETLGMNRDARQNPLSQVMFQLQSGGYQQQNAENVDFGVEGLSVHQQPSRLSETKVDLSWYMMERESGYLVTIEYRSALFDHWRVERMADHFAELLGSIIRSPNERLPKLHYMSPEERQSLIALGTPVAKALPAAAVHDAISDIARRYPESIAVESGGRAWTYQDLDSEANSLAHILLSMPDAVRPGDRVAVSLPGEGHLIIAFLAILKAGAVYVPLDPGHPADRVSYMLEDAGVKVIVTDRPQFYAKHRCLDPTALNQMIEPVMLPPGDPERIAYLLYTSGSTGRPNGVPINHASLLNHLRSMAETPGMKPGDRMLAITTPTFDISILEMFLPLSVGATVILYDQDLLLAPAKLAQVLDDDRISHMQATPAYWRMLIDSGWEGSPKLTALCGGEALDAPLAKRLLERTAILWNVYGPTEATIWASALQVSSRHVARGKVPIGGLVDNTHLHVLDAYHEPVPKGIPGDLYIGGVCLSPGYWSRPALAAARFVPNPFYDHRSPALRLYRTGDAVVRLDGDEIEFIGRTDFQVKLRGYRIEIGEIEDLLLRQSTVEQAIVTLDEANERLIAYVLVQDPSVSIGDAQTERQLRQSLTMQLPRYMVPTAFVILREFPLNPNGKVDRSRLPVPQVIPGNPIPVAPRYTAEETLLGVWKDVLKRDDFGVEDNFFDLGGDSIIGVQIVARAQALGIPLAPTQIFELQTVAAQAAVVEAQFETATLRQSLWQRYTRDADHDPWLVILPSLGSEAVALQACEIVAAHHPALRGRLNAEPAGTGADLEDADNARLVQWARDVTLRGGEMALGMRSFRRNGDHVCAIAVHPLLIDAHSFGWIVNDLKETAQRLSAGAAGAALHAAGDYAGWLDRAETVMQDGAAPQSAGKSVIASPLAGSVAAFLDPQAVGRLKVTARHLASTLEAMVLTALRQALSQVPGFDDLNIDLLTDTRPDPAQRRTVGNFTRLLRVSSEAQFTADGLAFMASAQEINPVVGHGGEVLLSWLNPDDPALELLSNPRSNVPGGYALVLESSLTSDGLDLRWRYDPARFGAAAIDQLAARHLDVLAAVKADGSAAAAKVDRLLEKLRIRKD